ncbi:MAG: hypothetical protein M3270_07985 [Thermoproteota archaeon]|nr:hypothetical protein [Thermoproteota archaeon]
MEIVAPVVYLHVRQPVVGPFTALEEFDALISFTFNAGSGNFERSILRSDINAGHCDPDIITHDFVDWSNTDDNARRNQEADMFNS